MKSQRQLILLIVICSFFIFSTAMATGDSYFYKSYGQDEVTPGSGATELVNLLTGDMQYSVPLISIGSKKSLSFGLTLYYSSDIDSCVSGDNTEYQAPVCGLGWDLKMPFISAEFQETWPDSLGSIPNPFYKSFWYNEGNTKNNMTNSNPHIFKNYKFWRITHKKTLPIQNDIDSWEIIKEDGTKYIFAHKRKRVFRDYALRYLPPSYTEQAPVLTSQGMCDSISYQWDLSAIEDVYGNKLTFHYEDDISYISDYYIDANQNIQTDLNYATYIRASYLTKIKDEVSNRSLLLTWENRTDYADTKTGFGTLEDTGGIDSDSHQETIITKRLKNITYYDADTLYISAHKIKSIDLAYSYQTYVNDSKLLLTEIRDVDPLNSSNWKPALKFAYQTTNDNNMGALKEILYPMGGKKVITFEARGSNGYRVETIDHYDQLNSYKRFDYSWSAVTGHKYHSYVTIDIPGFDYGKVKYYHDLLYVFGTVEKIQYFKQTDPANPDKEIKKDWALHNMGPFNMSTSYFTKLTRDSIGVDNNLILKYYYYNTNNGLISELCENNYPSSDKVTHIKYAFEEYSQMDTTKHMLSQIAQESVLNSTVDDSSSVSSSNITTWKDWGNGRWAPSKTYSWLEDDAATSMPRFRFDLWSDTSEPPTNNEYAEWKKTSKIVSMDSLGNLLLIQDADGNTVTTIFEPEKILPIAVGVNGNSEQFAFASFEQNNNWGTSDSVVFDPFAHSGYHVVKVYKDGPNEYYPNKNFYEIGGLSRNCGYKASVWVKGSAHAFLAMKINNSEANAQYAYSKGTGEWELLQVSMSKDIISANMNGDDYINIYLGNEELSPVYFDDLNFFPDNGILTSTVYDSVTWQTTSEFDANNIPTYYNYDSYGTLLEALNHKKELVTRSDIYRSREGNSDVFSSSDPNFVKKSKIPEENFREDFQYSDSPENHGWKIYDGTGSIATNFDNTLKSYVLESTTAQGTSFGIRYPDNGKLDCYSPHLWVKIKDSDSFVFYVRVLASNDTEYYLTYQPNSSSISPWINDAYIFINLGTEYQNGEWHIFERDLQADLQATGLTIDFVCVRWFCIRGDFEMDDIRLTDHPLSVKSFADGFGRPFQEQTQFGKYDLVSNVQLNYAGKPVKQNKVQKINNFTHAFISSVPDSSEIIEYTKDPLMRLEKVKHLDNSEIQYEYGSKTIDSNNRRYMSILNEKGLRKTIYYDRKGNNILTIQADSTADDANTQYVYDNLDQIIEVRPPNYHTGDIPSGTTALDWKTTFEYDTFGQWVKRNTPDDSTTIYYYNQLGNLRFAQDASQAVNDYFTVYCYDALGRLTCVGEEKSTSWNAAIANPAGDYGTGANEWRTKSYYDLNYCTGIENFCHGQLTKVEVNDDSDDTVEHTTKYIYDISGNMVEKRITIDGGSPLTEKCIKHEYNNLGQEVFLHYPSGMTLYKEYDAVGRLKNIIRID